MKKVLLTGAALGILVVGTAVAQTPPPPPGPPPGGPDGPGRPHFPGPGPGMMGPGGPGHGPERMMHMMEMMSKGAAFHLRRGESRLDIKCAENEPMKACVDAATALLDKVSSLRSQSQSQ